VLTLDDGPDEDATPEVLDALDTVRAHATFFVLATQLERHPDIAREIVGRGHEIGLHGYRHERHDRISAVDSRDDLVRGFAVVQETTGVKCRWFRPPYGKMSEASAKACRELGMTTVYWSAWGLDWEEVGPERIARVAAEQVYDGGILLLHDSARYARRSSALATARALPMIAERLGARGISLVSVGEAA
jgi:peptidoglycan/xylan/chitin deacetylase (PgdA/CDA1 family)